MQVVNSLISKIQKATKLQRPSFSSSQLLLWVAFGAILSAALIVRIIPAKYGFYLNEFDPYFDYYGSKFLVDSFNEKGITGFLDYFTWIDTKTWYPEGRPVARTSQVGLHFAGAIFYLIATNILQVSTTLYDAVVIFPVIFGTATVIPIYLITKRIAGNGGGLLAALLFAYSPHIINRGNIGWFKSEPFALFLALSGSYLFLTLYDRNLNGRAFIMRALLAGALLGYANTSWGGSLFFNVVFTTVLVFTPFIASIDQRKAIYGNTIFVVFYLLTTAMFPRPGPSILTNPAGIGLLGALGFTLLAYAINNLSSLQNNLATIKRVLFSGVIVGVIVVSFNVISGVSGRYQTAIYPYLRSGNPLVESVAEHLVPSGATYISSYLIILPLAVFGSILLLRQRDIASLYVLSFGLSATYLAASFSRLLVFTSIGFGFLAAFGFIMLTKNMFRPGISVATKTRAKLNQTSPGAKFVYSIIMILLISFPVISPATSLNWIDSYDNPYAISNGGAGAARSDWFEALTWINQNTPEDSVVAAWWDYGYWITVMGNRTSIADNATINGTRIARIGQTLMAPEAQALSNLRDFDADYVLIYIGGQKITQEELDGSVYTLGGGGDESKKQWFIKIGGLEMDDYTERDSFTPNGQFWEATLLGKMMPFAPYKYVDRSDGQLYDEYQDGRIAVYQYSQKYPQRGVTDGLQLAFASSSVQAGHPDGAFGGVLIYEVVDLEEPSDDSSDESSE